MSRSLHHGTTTLVSDTFANKELPEAITAHFELELELQITTALPQTEESVGVQLIQKVSPHFIRESPRLSTFWLLFNWCFSVHVVGSEDGATSHLVDSGGLLNLGECEPTPTQLDY